MKEPKLKTVYVCSNCGETSPRWMGRCPSCGSWNTMNEDVVAEAPKAGLSSSKAAAPARQEGVTSLTARRLADISTTEEKSRILTGISELDRVLGGGIVLGGVVLLSGEPGVGKSTICCNCAVPFPISIAFCISRAKNRSGRSSCVQPA